jgi:nitrogen fixation NifU-like protein
VRFACGDVMKLQIKVVDGVIQDARFKTYGCGSAIASVRLLLNGSRGRTLDQAEQIKNSEIANELPSQLKFICSILAEDGN